MRRFFALWLLIFSTTIFNALAQSDPATKRALIVGINQYEGAARAGWNNLSGAINDAKAIQAKLLSRYEFDQENINLLVTPEATTGVNLRKALQDLADAAQPDDIVFFYYAGHGAQVKNNQYSEADRKHEALVPSDGNDGVEHFILDTELNQIYQQIEQKGALLTVIFDNCHSGSGSRGPMGAKPYTERKIPFSPDLDLDQAVPESKELGQTIFLSASQDYQTAKEWRDENNTPRGIFTYALVQAMEYGNANEPVSELFKKTSAIMAHHGNFMQTPSLSAEGDLAKRSLFGKVSPEKSQGSSVAIIDASNPQYIKLQGGSAHGLTVGSTLYKQQEQSRTYLEVIRVENLQSAIARKTEGTANLKAGDLVYIDPSRGRSHPKVAVYLPAITANSIEQIGTQIDRLPEMGIQLANTPNDREASFVFFDGKSWVLSDKCGTQKKIGSKFAADKVKKGLRSLARQCPGIDSKPVFVNLPPQQALVDYFKQNFGSGSQVRIAPSAAQSHYQLTGRWQNGQAEYSWTKTHIADQPGKYPTPTPEETIWHSTSEPYYEITLNGYALQLGKLRYWMTVPPLPNSAHFPYYMGLQKKDTKNILDGGKVKEGETYDIILYSNPEELSQWTRKNRYIYIVGIFSDGSMGLVYGGQAGANTNTIQTLAYKDGEYLSQVNINSPIKISAPFGSDILMMISSVDPITDAKNLFYAPPISSAGTRGVERVEPAENWTIQRLYFISESRYSSGK